MTFDETFRQNRLAFLFTLLLLMAVYAKVVPDMARQWYEDANYSHGFLVPLVAGFFVWERRRLLATTVVEPWWPGLILLIFAMLQLVVGRLGMELFTMRSSLVVALGGITLFFFGRRLFRLMLLPLAYLLFMVPLPYLVYDAIAFPLKLFVTRVSIAFLQMAGVVVLREGNVIQLPLTTLEVADACSGIRSLISLLALAVACACFLKLPAGRRVALVVAAVPIAIFANALRVIGTGLLAQYWGARAAEGFFHEFAGLVVFMAAAFLLVALGALLSRKKEGPC
ncbi:exosortase/archaeosortase family protein [Geomonas sp. Red32]|uniref:exosortase A n=1 Tax=Geomonas sp. Red32 TaxID=2912856 RepID=UPI00202CD96F|nr:exosortase/archaeosortase family protein [Geomonas sp. Red32]